MCGATTAAWSAWVRPHHRLDVTRTGANRRASRLVAAYARIRSIRARCSRSIWPARVSVDPGSARPAGPAASQRLELGTMLGRQPHGAASFMDERDQPGCISRSCEGPGGATVRDEAAAGTLNSHGWLAGPPGESRISGSPAWQPGPGPPPQRAFDPLAILLECEAPGRPVGGRLTQVRVPVPERPAWFPAPRLAAAPGGGS
jgi:hypothetical protein